MKRRIKFSLWTTAIIVLSIAGMIVFSPYGSQPALGYPAVMHSVVIDAPVDSVYGYLGNSGNAHYWSVFVDHITTLNADTVRDGTVGSRRRCFQYADETGAVWDELTTEVIANKKRQLTIYNMKGFFVQADGLATEQLYEPLEGGMKCRLTLTLFYLEHHPGMIDQIKTYYAAYKVKSIFAGNLEKIKQNAEARQTMYAGN